MYLQEIINNHQKSGLQITPKSSQIHKMKFSRVFSAQTNDDMI